MGYISAVKKEYEAKKLRKAGKMAQVAVNVRMPIIKISHCLSNTVEGSVLRNRLPREQYNEIDTAYNEINSDTRYSMMFAAKSGEYLERAEWWKSFLQSVLGTKESALAMSLLYRWYRRCIQEFQW